MNIKIRDLPTFLPRPPMPTHLGGQGESGTRYEILERLGEGATAVVYACRVTDPGDSKTARSFAMKILFPLQRIVPTDRAYERLRLRFMQEARRSRHLTHSNLPRVLDSGELAGADAHPFYVMQLVNGDALSDLFETKKPQLGERLSWATSLARTVAFLHSRGILHRDIKPANILIEHDSGKLFLSDFGVLQWGEVAADYTDGIDTYDSEVLTTWDYLAPEIEANPEHYAPSADVWSLGKTLAEMFTWRHIPRSSILTGQFDLSIDCESKFCAGLATSALVPSPSTRSPIERIIGRLDWYAALWAEVQGLGPENFAKALSKAGKAVQMGAHNYEQRRESVLDKFECLLERIKASGLPEELETWQDVLNYDDTWQKPKQPCLKCRSECTFRYYYFEYIDGEEYAEFVCLGTPGRPCGHVWSSTDVYHAQFSPRRKGIF